MRTRLFFLLISILLVISFGVAGAQDDADELLFSFEDGMDGWALADYWPAGTGLDVSAEDASDGAQSLALSGSFPGDSWSETGAFHTFAEAQDWSAYANASVDIYLPEDATNFLAQIFVKTGDDWTWANTPDISLVAGEWNTLTGDLATLGDMTDVKEVGVKVGTSVTAFEGAFLIDKLRLEGAAAPVEEATEEDGGLSLDDTTLLYSFEGDLQRWEIMPDWSAVTDIALSDEQASDGDSALAVTLTTSGEAWNEGGPRIILDDGEAGADWSGYAGVAVDVYVPEGVEGFIAQIFAKTGDGWSWANTGDVDLIPGEWTTVTGDFDALGAERNVREFGIKIGSNSTAFDGEFFVDNVRLLGAAQAAATAELVNPIVNEITALTALADTVEVYDKAEFVAEIDAQFNNPYDPTDIRVDARVEGPDGNRVTIPAFWYRDFTYDESLTPTEDWSWRVRFTPTEVGEWRVRVIATTINGNARSEWVTITATETDDPGFVRVDPRNPLYFAFDDGTPYFPVGENMGWSIGADPIADYAMWLDELEAHGGNFIRTWMASWGFGIEWADTGLGNYDNRQDRAYQLDSVLDLLAERDIYMMLTFINHGQFNEQTNPEWDANPFNIANGGMLERPEDFATNPEARRLWNQRLRYIAARWGYSPNIMAWEWWNEVNWTPLVNSELLAPWMSSSAAYLDSLDPYDRLMTHSGSPMGDGSIWDADHMDFTQAHLYNMSDLPLTFGQVIPDWLETYPDKPFLMGEFGSPIDLDTEGVLLHLGLWSAPMNGAAGTGMFWWWDTYIHPNDLYYHFEGVAAFYAEEDLAAHEWRQADLALTEDARARAYGLQTDDSALVWVVNTDYSDRFLRQQYNRNLRNGEDNPEQIAFPVVDGAVLTITGLQQGTYAVEIWDTLHGEIVDTTSVTVTDGMLAIPLPAFTIDHAIKIRRGA